MMKFRIATWPAGVLTALILSLPAMPTQASPSDILAVVFSKSNGAWRVDVTIRHPDTGWDHYTDVWVVAIHGW